MEKISHPTDAVTRLLIVSALDTCFWHNTAHSMIGHPNDIVVTHISELPIVGIEQSPLRSHYLTQRPYITGIIPYNNIQRQYIEFHLILLVFTSCYLWRFELIKELYTVWRELRQQRPGRPESAVPDRTCSIPIITWLNKVCIKRTYDRIRSMTGLVALHIPSWRVRECEKRRQARKTVRPLNVGRGICHYQKHSYGITKHHKHICYVLEEKVAALSIITMNHIDIGVKTAPGMHSPLSRTRLLDDAGGCNFTHPAAVRCNHCSFAPKIAQSCCNNPLQILLDVITTTRTNHYPWSVCTTYKI